MKKYIITFILLIATISFAAGFGEFGNSIPSIESWQTIVSKFASGSCTGYLKSDGTCSTEAGSIAANVPIVTNSLTATGGTISGITSLTVSGTADITAITPAYNTIGMAGQNGFGVGVCPPSKLPTGFTPMQGYNNPSSSNYGNYQFTDGSVMVYIPKFYYRMHTWATNQITAITKANPAQVTQTAHGYVDGDIIFLTNVGGMSQVNNLFFTVTKVDDDKYTIGVDSSAYTAFTSLGDSTKGFGTTFEFNDTIIAYGKNSIQVKGYDTYATTTAAAVDGYVLHRSFIDGGTEQLGFFIDKYKNSKVANGSGYTAASIKRGKPLSPNANHNPFTDLTGGANYAYSAVDLAHRRDGVNGAVNANSIFHVKSVFQNSALAMLSLVHGQYSQTDTYCAWYNATYNYPKGCNSGGLKDSDDATVTFTSDGYSQSCTAGSGVALAKTTHNGQASGVTGVNGGMYEVEIGVTAIAGTKTVSAISAANPCEITTSANHGLTTGDYVQITAIAAGTLATAINDKIWQVTKTADDKFTIILDSSALSAWASGGTVTYGTFYAANTTTAMKSYTAGNTLATDHWGATGVATTMTAFIPPFKSGYAFAVRMGSGTEQVLSPASTGNGYVLTSMGLPKAGTAVDATGTNLFGKDYFYQNIVNDLCLISSGSWSASTVAGVWLSLWYYPRTYAYYALGFRLACYPE